MTCRLQAALSCGSSAVAVFPGAGSFGGEFRPLLRELAPAWLVRYPGRFGPDFGRPAATFNEVVRSGVDQVRHREPAARLVLLGHSFGAYVAYATAAELQELGTEPSALVVVGATAPGLMSVPEAATRNRPDIVAYLGSIDAGILPNGLPDEWAEVVLDAARQDLRLLTEFNAPGYQKLRCPVFAACGEADPLTSASGISKWADIAAAGFDYRVFPGGHSDLLRSSDFASWLYMARAREG